MRTYPPMIQAVIHRVTEVLTESIEPMADRSLGTNDPVLKVVRFTDKIGFSFGLDVTKLAPSLFVTLFVPQLQLSWRSFIDHFQGLPSRYSTYRHPTTCLFLLGIRTSAIWIRDTNTEDDCNCTYIVDLLPTVSRIVILVPTNYWSIAEC